MLVVSETSRNKGRIWQRQVQETGHVMTGSAGRGRMLCWSSAGTEQDSGAGGTTGCEGE